MFTLALLLPHAVAAAPITIDFEELRADDALIRFVGSTYSSHGFTFTASVPLGTDNDPGFNTIGTRSSSFAGSTPLYNLNGFGVTTLTRTDGGRFSLFSIDLAETPNFDAAGNPVDLGAFSLTFFGQRAHGPNVEATATISAFPGTTTFLFAGFTDLDSVSWVQGGGGARNLTHQFDNVRVLPVFEPSTLLLLGLGLSWATVRSRKQERHSVDHSGQLSPRLRRRIS
jgi:hypothetical protein